MSELTLRQKLTEQGLLDRFSERAIAFQEQLGVRWIELEGELFTPVFHLEECKGVEKQDFAKNAVMVKQGHRAYSEKKARLPEAALRLLKVPGAKWASIPTAFEVEGGYAISCTGAKRNDDMLSIVRAKWGSDFPKSCSQFLLANVPLALAYLQHGCSEKAKSTRDFTIGTTMDVGKVAAQQENAPAIVQQLGGNGRLTAALNNVFLALAEEQEITTTRVDQHDAQLSEHSSLLSEQKNKIETLEKEKEQLRRDFQKANNDYVRHLGYAGSKAKCPKDLRDRVWDRVQRYCGGKCLKCDKPLTKDAMQVDRMNTYVYEDANVWGLHIRCNNQLGKPGSNKRTSEIRRKFDAFQELAGTNDQNQQNFWAA